MSSILVATFSASGVSGRLAKQLAASVGADLFEIVPVKPYTDGDLNWMNPLARCNREHLLKSEVPVAGKVENFSVYTAVFIGFPIWYGVAWTWSIPSAADMTGAGKTSLPLPPPGGAVSVIRQTS